MKMNVGHGAVTALAVLLLALAPAAAAAQDGAQDAGAAAAVEAAGEGNAEASNNYALAVGWLVGMAVEIWGLCAIGSVVMMARARISLSRRVAEAAAGFPAEDRPDEDAVWAFAAKDDSAERRFKRVVTVAILAVTALEFFVLFPSLVSSGMGLAVSLAAFLLGPVPCVALLLRELYVRHPAERLVASPSFWIILVLGAATQVLSLALPHDDDVLYVFVAYVLLMLAVVCGAPSFLRRQADRRRALFVEALLKWAYAPYREKAMKRLRATCPGEKAFKSAWWQLCESEGVARYPSMVRGDIREHLRAEYPSDPRRQEEEWNRIYSAPRSGPRAARFSYRNKKRKGGAE